MFESVFHLDYVAGSIKALARLGIRQSACHKAGLDAQAAAARTNPSGRPSTRFPVVVLHVFSAIFTVFISVSILLRPISAGEDQDFN